MSFLANPNILKHPDSQEESFGGTSILIGQIPTIYWDYSGMKVTIYNFLQGLCLEKYLRDNKSTYFKHFP